MNAANLDSLFYRNLSPETARARTSQALDGMDDGELFLEYTQSESLAFDDGTLKTASFNTSAGFGLRAVKGETAAYAHASDISERALQRAAETVRGAAWGQEGIAALHAPPFGTNTALYEDDQPVE